MKDLKWEYHIKVWGCNRWSKNQGQPWFSISMSLVSYALWIFLSIWNLVNSCLNSYFFFTKLFTCPACKWSKWAHWTKTVFSIIMQHVLVTFFSDLIDSYSFVDPFLSVHLSQFSLIKSSNLQNVLNGSTFSFEIWPELKLNSTFTLVPCFKKSLMASREELLS